MRRGDAVSDQVVMITGAAGGIGAATARLLGGLGARLVLTALESRARLSDVVLPPGAPPPLLLQHDVSDRAAWERVMARVLEVHGRLDVLVNNAGIVEPGSADGLPLEKLERQVAVNILGVMHGCRAALKAMRAQGSGRIVNIASLGGLFPMPGEAAYCATKWAVRGYTFSLRAELKGTGIEVCVVCPDSVETPQLAYEMGHEEASLSFVDKALVPEEVAVAILQALRKRKPEILVPSGAGVLARIAMAFPGFVMWLMPMLRRIGERNRSRRLALLTDGRSLPSPGSGESLEHRERQPERGPRPPTAG